MSRLLFFLMLSIGLSAQNLQLAWFTQNDHVNIVDSEMDPWGNIVVAGTFTGIVDFDHGPHVRLDTAVGIYDMFIAKYDAYGNLLWVHSLGNNNPEKIKALDIDASGNIYAVGEFTRSMDFDPGPGVRNLQVVGYADIFLWALRPNGDLYFAKAFGDASLESPNDISVNDLGEIAITGFYWGNGDMDPTPGYFPFVNRGQADIFVFRLTPGGNPWWIRHFGSSKEDQALNIELGNDGEIYLQGFFEDSVDFNPDTLSTATFYLDANVSGEGFFLHLSPQGLFKSAMACPLVPQKMELVNDQSLYFSGYFSGSRDFDPDSTLSFNLNAVGNQTPYYAWNIDTGWTFKWANMWGEAKLGKSSLSLSRAGDEGVIISAPFSGSMDLDPGNGTRNASSNGFEDIFIAHLDSAGQLLFGHTWGGGQSDIPALAMVNGNGEIYVGGRFRGTMDFDPDPLITDNGSAVGLESFMLKLTYCQEVYGYDTIDACNSYTWINSFTYNDNSSGDRYIMQSPSGCDSLVYLHLNMNFIDSTASQWNDSTLIATQPLAKYQWIDCDSGLPIIGEINREFYPDSSGNYAVIISTQNCVDTSACILFSKPIGISEEEAPIMISAFPNPSKGLVNIESSNNLFGSPFMLTDLQGRILLQGEMGNGNRHEIHLPPQKGIYLLQVIQDGERHSLRLIKE